MRGKKRKDEILKTNWEIKEKLRGGPVKFCPRCYSGPEIGTKKGQQTLKWGRGEFGYFIETGGQIIGEKKDNLI